MSNDYIKYVTILLFASHYFIQSQFSKLFTFGKKLDIAQLQLFTDQIKSPGYSNLIVKIGTY